MISSTLASQSYIVLRNDLIRYILANGVQLEQEPTGLSDNVILLCAHVHPKTTHTHTSLFQG